MSFLTELSDELEDRQLAGMSPDLVVLGENKFDELLAAMTKTAPICESAEKATRRPTFDGYPILVDYDCPEIVEFYYK